MKHIIAVCLLTLTSSLCFAQNYTLMTTEPSKVAEGEKSVEHLFVEVINEVFLRSGLKLNIKEGHWIRNQKKVSTASAKEKLLIIPLTRTEERENLYDWIVPIISYELQFITTDKSIDITNIDAIKNLPICAYRESPAQYKLKELGFTDIQAKVQEQICFDSLSKNKFKLMLAHGKVAAIQGFKNINADPEKLIYGKSFPKETVYLASTKKAVSKADKKKLNDAFTAIQADGTYDKIYASF
jgi:polar amino acid transport system substrate-binding protein